MNGMCKFDGCGYHSATSAHVDLAIDNNVTWSDAFAFGTAGDTSWTLTGQSFEMNVQRNRFDPTPLLHMTTAAGQIITDDPVQRVIHLNVSPASIQAALTPGCYVFDLVMADNSVPPIRVALMHGKVQVNQGVTYP
jgi:hypothetical protein